MQAPVPLVLLQSFIPPQDGIQNFLGQSPSHLLALILSIPVTNPCQSLLHYCGLILGEAA